MRQLKIQKSITNRSSEALDKYLVEIGRVPMISVDEEIELAQAIRKGGREGMVDSPKHSSGYCRAEPYRKITIESGWCFEQNQQRDIQVRARKPT